MNKGSYYWKCAAFAVVGYLVLGLVTMFLWNWLMPYLFNTPSVSYLQALGLLALSKILFWGLHKKQHHHSAGPNRAQWNQHFRDKLSSLNPEEREVFKQRMKEKWCKWEQQKSDESSSPTE